MMSEHKQNWKVFNDGSEAARLLSRLYGVSPSASDLITYPKVKIKKRQLPLRWNAVSKDSSNNDKKNYKSNVRSLKIPKFGNARTNMNNSTLDLIDILPRRKKVQTCLQEIEKVDEMMSAYRPPNRTCLSETEKERLSNVFAFKGGTALPTELTHPISLMPEEVEWDKKEKNRVNKAKEKRRSKLNDVDNVHGCSEFTTLLHEKEKEVTEQLVDQIVLEIEERRMFQKQMEQEECGEASRKKIACEISLRLIQLQKLDPKRAETMKRKKVVMR